MTDIVIYTWHGNSLNVKFIDSCKIWHRCHLPLKAAHVLRKYPQCISDAVDIFVNRDGKLMKEACKLKNYEAKDFVDANVLFNKCSYAKMIQSEFHAPKNYPMPSISSSKFKSAELGMKITMALEMLCCTEDDIRSDDYGRKVLKEDVVVENEKWDVFLNIMKNNVYFKDKLKDEEILDCAKNIFKKSLSDPNDYDSLLMTKSKIIKVNIKDSNN